MQYTCGSPTNSEIRWDEISATAVEIIVPIFKLLAIIVWNMCAIKNKFLELREVGPFLKFYYILIRLDGM